MPRAATGATSDIILSCWAFLVRECFLANACYLGRLRPARASSWYPTEAARLPDGETVPNTVRLGCKEPVAGSWRGVDGLFSTYRHSTQQSHRKAVRRRDGLRQPKEAGLGRGGRVVSPSPRPRRGLSVQRPPVLNLTAALSLICRQQINIIGLGSGRGNAALTSRASNSIRAPAAAIPAQERAFPFS